MLLDFALAGIYLSGVAYSSKPLMASTCCSNQPSCNDDWQRILEAAAHEEVLKAG